MLPFYVRLTVIKKIKENNVGNGEKREPLYIVGRNAKWYSNYGTSY